MNIDSFIKSLTHAYEKECPYVTNGGRICYECVVKIAKQSFIIGIKEGITDKAFISADMQFKIMKLEEEISSEHGDPF